GLNSFVEPFLVPTAVPSLQKLLVFPQLPSSDQYDSLQAASGGGATCDAHELAREDLSLAATVLPRQQSSSSSISIPQNAPDGGITIIEPAATAQATYYKIDSANYITFAWNFTEVLVQPSSLTLQAYCSQNSFTYPIGPTQGLAGDTIQYAWSPADYEASSGATPLAEASYTLRIFRENGYAAAATPGYMRSYAGTVFALYRPQSYTGLADGWTCASCSAAIHSTRIHPAVLATAAAFFYGTITVYRRLQ
ncbi:MAG: hypothetical protein CYPHOPRED_003173, partial [Cyphobasidiales sp. Tagirdzhanova-0007]